MALSPVGTSYDNAFCMPSSALNTRVPALNRDSHTNGSYDSYFAKKGEPMYMEEMDADEDGIVSLEEFKDYCKEKGISSRDMNKMIEKGNSYRELMNQVQKKDEKSSLVNFQPSELLERINSKSNDRIYAVRGDDKYNEAIDTNGDDKITYKEYVDYCVEHAKTNEQKSNTRVEKTDNGVFKTISYGKAINAYARAESEPVPGMYEYEA